jgi:predicted enzyme related to lactoylglutathione lyase
MRTESEFFHLTLRTLDVAAARDFYAAVLGVNGAQLDVVPLHEAAIAKGARPHWLCFLDVGEVEPAAAAFVQRGATAMGPKWVNPQGLEAAMMRDPGGALLALAKPPALPRPGGTGLQVAWYVLYTPEVETAKKNYAEQFGWHFEVPIQMSGFTLHRFAWRQGALSSGHSPRSRTALEFIRIGSFSSASKHFRQGSTPWSRAVAMLPMSSRCRLARDSSCARTRRALLSACRVEAHVQNVSPGSGVSSLAKFLEQTCLELQTRVRGQIG